MGGGSGGGVDMLMMGLDAPRAAEAGGAEQQKVRVFFCGYMSGQIYTTPSRYIKDGSANRRLSSWFLHSLWIPKPPAVHCIVHSHFVYELFWHGAVELLYVGHTRGW